MDWIPTALMIAAIACVTLHGALLLFGKGLTSGQRVAGVLNLLLATSAFSAYFLFASGSLIISPEYSVVLAEGTGAWIWCLTTILLIPFAVWMALHSVRVSQNRTSHVSVTLPLGALCGLWTVIRVSQLNRGTHSPYTIYCVDLWSCPLLVWVAICIVDWCFTMLKIRDHAVRICGSTFVLSYFALWANQKVQGGFVFADKYTLKSWWVVAWICIPATLVLLTWIALRKSGAWLRRIAQILASAVAGLIGLATAVAATTGAATLWQVAVVWGVWVALLLFALIPRMRSCFREGKFSDWRKDWICPDALTLAAFALFGVCIADLAHFIGVDPTWDLTLLVAAWLALQESSMEYPLTNVGRKMVQAVSARVRAILGRFKRQPHADAAPALPGIENAGGGKTSWRVLLTSLAVLVVLIAVPEFFNAGKTIVEPFTTSLAGSDKSQEPKSGDLGKAVADRTVNTLGLLGQQLRPDLLISGDKNGTSVPATMDEMISSQAVGSGNNLQIPGTPISIPFGFFATPIQRPLRALLRVTVVQGTLQQDGSKFVLLADASDGRTWRVDEEPLAGTCLADASSAPQPAQPAKDEKADTAVAPAAEVEIVDQLAKGLAYRITSSDTGLTQLGITSEWRAIPDFRSGLARWQSFERTGNYGDLSLAIGCFRAAIGKDPNFALAHYRLGLALEQDGQPGLAIGALRRSIQVNPRFVAGHLALAQALSYYDTYLFPSPPSLAENHDVVGSGLPPEGQYRQSAVLIRRVLDELKQEASPTDRAEAYVGLCRNELYFRNEDFIQKSLPAGAPQLMEQYRQFFYCKRAEYLYSKLSSSLRAEVRVRPNEQWVVRANGYILAHSLDRVSDYQAAEMPKGLWACDEPLIRSNYLKFAATYYRRAIALDPDDAEALCGYAMSRVSANPDDTAPLEEMAHTAAAHLTRGATFASDADALYQQDVAGSKACKPDEKLNDKYYAIFREYGIALDYDPSNADALNNFAYQVYKWHLQAARHPQLLEYPPPKAYEIGKKYAAAASRLTEAGGTRIEHRVIESTTGELDLATGDAEGAVRVLEESLQSAAREHTGIEHASYDEIRWDLAQAYACVGPGTADKAREQLTRIFDEEKSREDQRFVGAADDTFVDRNFQVLQANCRIFTNASQLPDSEEACSGK